jgi:hypothetical protein
LGGQRGGQRGRRAAKSRVEIVAARLERNSAMRRDRLAHDQFLASQGARHRLRVLFP